MTIIKGKEKKRNEMTRKEYENWKKERKKERKKEIKRLKEE